MRIGLLVTLVLLLPACGPDEAPEVEIPSWAKVAPEQIAENREKPPLSTDDMARIIRTHAPTAELTAELLASHPLQRMGAQYFATTNAHGVEFLNVIDHTVRLRRINRTQWPALRAWVRAAVFIEGRVEEVLKESSLPLTYRIILSQVVPLSEIRHLGDQSESLAVRLLLEHGEDADLREWVGRDRIMRVELGRNGATCYGTHWRPTGREGEVFRQFAPLTTTDPFQLLDHASASDDVVRWLATVQIVMGCRELDERWNAWGDALHMEHLAARGSQIVDLFESIAPILKWETVRDAFAFEK